RIGGPGVKLSWLAGGGLFRWLTRGVVVGALLLVLGLRYLFGVHIILSALAGFSLLLAGLLVVFLLTLSGRIRIELWPGRRGYRAAPARRGPRGRGATSIGGRGCARCPPPHGATPWPSRPVRSPSSSRWRSIPSSPSAPSSSSSPR